MLANTRCVGLNVENDHLLSRTTNIQQITSRCAINAILDALQHLVLCLTTHLSPGIHPLPECVPWEGLFMYAVLSGLKVYINPILVPYENLFFFSFKEM